MPSKKKSSERTRKNHDPSIIEKARRAIEDQNLSRSDFVMRRQTPRSTLVDKLDGKYGDGKKMGRATNLTEEEENSLVKSVKV